MCCVYTLYVCVSANFAHIIIIIIIIIIVVVVVVVVVVDLYSQHDPVKSNSSPQSREHSFCRNLSFSEPTIPHPLS